MSEVLVILMLIGLSCSLLGSLLVLRNQVMIADALSHSVLLGIVLGFFISHSLDSPLLTLGATVFGVLTVIGIEQLTSPKLAHDAATGLVFSAFFALAVLLISLFARNVHLDMDMVLMGEVLFAPLYRMSVLGLSLPVALVKASVVLLGNVVFFSLVYRRLALVVFDPVQAQLIGIPVKAVQLLTMCLVSLTTVTAFDAVGSISVISLMVAPAMTAHLMTRRFLPFLGMTMLVSLFTVSLGYHLAMVYDLTVAGTCAGTGLLVYLLLLFLRGVQ